MYAFGEEATSTKFNPVSISTAEVFNRIGELAPSFTDEIKGFCSLHVGRRNAELHTGEMVFSALGTSEWLSRFYLASKILLELMGRELKDFVADHATAQSMIESLSDAAARAVKQEIQAHATVWQSKSAPERESALLQSTAWATRQAGHRVNCPACKSTGLVSGNPAGTVTSAVVDDEVVQKQTMLPSAFECIACGLRISGLSKLSACALGDAFTATTVYTAAEFFGLHTEDELDEARREAHTYEEDFNEY